MTSVAATSERSASMSGHVAPRVTTARLPSLRYWRLQRAITQVELAERAGLTQSTLWRLEAGRPATVVTMRKLAAALKVEPSALMGQPPEN